MLAFRGVGHRPAHPVRGWMFDAAVTLLVASFSFDHQVPGDGHRGVTAVVVAIALTAPLLVRRVWPSTVFGVLYAVSAVTGLWDVRLVASLGLVVALYTIAAQQSRRRALVAAGLLEVGVIVAVVRLNGIGLLTDGWWSAAIPGSGLVAAALGLGLYMSTRRAYLTELQDRAERLERDRDQQNELAAAAERGRISNEMHDILAHHLTVMIALSDGAVAASAKSPQAAAEAMRTVSATGRRALADTRQLLSGPGGQPSPVEIKPPDAVAASDAGRHPLPDLAGLDDLVAGVRQAGLPVSYEMQGAAAEVGSGAQLTVYRLVQEGLTNTLKHAGPGASAVVRLRYLPGMLRLEIEDDGAGAPALQPHSVGRGLTGMRQRVRAFGGDVEAGPRLPAGWRVTAHLPLGSATP